MPVDGGESFTGGLYMSFVALSEYLTLGKRSCIRGLCDCADILVVFLDSLVYFYR